MLTPDAVWLLSPEELANDPDSRRIRRVTAGGYGGSFALAVPNWETLEELSDKDRAELSKDFHRCILSPGTANEFYNLTERDGLNEGGRNYFEESDAQAFANALPYRQVWFNGSLYVPE